jgi:hypothetical protein
MRLHIVMLPDPVNDGSGDPQLLCQHPHTPVRAAVAGASLYRRIDDLLFQFRRQNAASIFCEGVAQRQNGGPR